MKLIQEFKESFEFRWVMIVCTVALFTLAYCGTIEKSKCHEVAVAEVMTCNEESCAYRLEDGSLEVLAIGKEVGEVVKSCDKEI